MVSNIRCNGRIKKKGGNKITLEALIQEARALPVAQRKQLIVSIIDSFDDETPQKTQSILEFRGVGAHLRADIDLQEYVNQLRAEWDNRP